MSFQFVESVTLYIPDVKKSITSFSESANDNKLIVEIAAIHQGLTSNFNMYTASQLENSLATWVQPYPRPIILNHDVYSDPVGRVMAARMDMEEDGTPFVRLQAAITNPEAIQRIVDNRYLTGSVGGKADAAMCSICGKNWAEAMAAQAPGCKHQRGQIYNGKLAYFELTGLSFKEYSFVNVPADPKSGVRNPITATTLGALGEESKEGEDKWVRPIKFFSLDMNKESVLELNESGENSEVLSSMKKKQAHFTYMNLKGTFLSTTAHDFSEKDEEIFTFMQSYTTIDKEPNANSEFNNINEQDKPAEERNMSEKDASQSVEDILAITEQLSADLASTSNDESAVNDEAIESNDTLSEELLEDSSEEADLDQVSEDSTEASVSVEDLVKGLRTCLANTVSVYHDAHGFHWNVKGPDFAEYHALFSSVYEDLYGSVDPMAESILKLGSDSPFRLSEFMLLRTVNEPAAASDNPQAMAGALHALVVQLIDGLKATFTTANELNEQGIANFIAGTIETLQKSEWQLRASAEGNVPAPAAKESDNKQLAEQQVDSDELAESSKVIDELTLSNNALKEENSRLKGSLHFMLAERVVDAKITVGAIEHDQRAEALRDHVSRSASSLADNMRDLEKYSRNYVKNVSIGAPNLELDVKAMATGPSSSINEAFIGEEVQTENVEQTAESILVDVLMGRKKL